MVRFNYGPVVAAVQSHYTALLAIIPSSYKFIVIIIIITINALTENGSSSCHSSLFIAFL